MMCTMTSPRSTSTHSPSRSPSTPIGGRPRRLAWRTTSSAIDLTCRLEVPLATTRVSATEVLPRTSIAFTSRAFMSSRARITDCCNCSTTSSSRFGLPRRAAVRGVFAGAADAGLRGAVPRDDLVPEAACFDVTFFATGFPLAGFARDPLATLRGARTAAATGFAALRADAVPDRASPAAAARERTVFVVGLPARWLPALFGFAALRAVTRFVGVVKCCNPSGFGAPPAARVQYRANPARRENCAATVKVRFSFDPCALAAPPADRRKCALSPQPSRVCPDPRIAIRRQQLRLREQRRWNEEARLAPRGEQFADTA